MADDEKRRPKRRCASRNASAMPSALHYVGYVEDDETPEMIMAKFGELERIKQAAGEARAEQVEAAAAAGPAYGALGVPSDDPAGVSAAAAAAAAAAEDPALTDEQLLEVFKQTSMFNVKTAMQDNAMLMGIDEVLEYTADRYGNDELISDEEDVLRSFWSDDDEEGYASEGEAFEGGRQRPRGRRSGGGSRGTSFRAQRNAGAARARHNVVTAYNPDTQALVRRRVRAADPGEILQLRIPQPPLPLSWGRAVKPYIPAALRGDRQEAVPAPPTAAPPPAAAAAAAATVPVPAEVAALQPTCTYLELPSLAQLDPKALPTHAYQAALINVGWQREGVAALSQLPMRQLVPAGFVFIWTPKASVQAVCRQMVKWGYVYIENLTWVYRAPNNAVLKLPSRFVRNSHLTLYMFRAADKGRDIELRHQRNPDVTFDCLMGAGGKGDVAAPDETFVAVETLLPTGKGKLLELWAPKGVRRPGWTHVVEEA